MLIFKVSGKIMKVEKILTQQSIKIGIEFIDIGFMWVGNIEGD